MSPKHLKQLVLTVFITSILLLYHKDIAMNIHDISPIVRLITEPKIILTTKL